MGYIQLLIVARKHGHSPLKYISQIPNALRNKSYPEALFLDPKTDIRHEHRIIEEIHHQECSSKSPSTAL